MGADQSTESIPMPPPLQRGHGVYANNSDDLRYMEEPPEGWGDRPLPLSAQVGMAPTNRLPPRPLSSVYHMGGAPDAPDPRATRRYTKDVYSSESSSDDDFDDEFAYGADEYPDEPQSRPRLPSQSQEVKGRLPFTPPSSVYYSPEFTFQPPSSAPPPLPTAAVRRYSEYMQDEDEW